MRSLLDRDGFAIVQGVLKGVRTEELARALDAQLAEVPAAGLRGLAQLVPTVRELAYSPEVRTLVESGLGAKARLVRSIYFSKSKEMNWQVAWHQDLAIAVRDKVEIDGFVSWSLKDGVPHVQPPGRVLDRMLTVRIHLDRADESNGALWVVPDLIVSAECPQVTQLLRQSAWASICARWTLAMPFYSNRCYYTHRKRPRRHGRGVSFIWSLQTSNCRRRCNGRKSPE